MKHDEIEGIYSVGSFVIVKDSASEYNKAQGTIARLGAAGKLVYYIVQLWNVATPITFVERQLRKEEHGREDHNNNAEFSASNK